MEQLDIMDNIKMMFDNTVMRNQKDNLIAVKPTDATSFEVMSFDSVIIDDENNLVRCGLQRISEITDIPDGSRKEKMVDGTMIYVWNYNGEWKVSTKGMVDAYESHWDSVKSFGQLFDECLNLSFEMSSLNPDNIYVFIISHPENIIGMEHTEKSIYHLATMNKSGELLDDTVEGVQGIPECSDTDIGYIVITPEGKRYKYFTEEYRYRRELRGNNPNMMYHYLTIRGDSKKKEDFIKYFPRMEEPVKQLEEKLVKISERIHYQYCGKYIMKNNNQIKPQFYGIIKDIHNDYKMRKSADSQAKTTKETTYNVLVNGATERIQFLLNRYSDLF
jgi:hypothetical protein